MSDQKPCVRCGRAIDGVARICPYCNWMQDEPVPPPSAAQVKAAAEYVPPPDRSWRKPVFGAIGGVLLLVGSFVIGVHSHGRNANTVVPAAQVPAPAATPAKNHPTANVTLVPDSSPSPVLGGTPITSAPVSDTAQGLASQYDRTDATAVASSEYAQMARKAAAEQQRGRVSPLVDPRTITGSAYGAPPPPSPARREAATAARSSGSAVTTPAVPQYQPLPQVRVRRNATARIELVIGSDGRVHEIRLFDPLPGDRAALIAAIQTWRYRPATRNGVPVPSSLMTAISFHAHE